MDKKISKDQIDAVKKTYKIHQFEQFTPDWITLDKIQSKNQPWFWDGMIPSHTITLFAGFGGIGKSLILLFIASQTTSGETFKAANLDFQLPQGSVILLSAEDDPEYQIKPKLLAMGADTSKIHFIKVKKGLLTGKNRFIELDKDIHLLEQKIEEVKDVKLIIIDPAVYFLGEINDSHNPEVANFLQSLIDLSKKYGISTIINKHLRKQATGAKGAALAADEVGGAGAWVNTPRRCWLITNWHEDPTIKIISAIKDNLGQRSEDCLAYKIVTATIEENGATIQTTKLEWHPQTIKLSADEAINAEHYEKSKLNRAIDFIYNYLKKNGQTRVKELRDKAIAQRLCSERTFKESEAKFESTFKDVLKISKGVNNQKMYMLSDE